MATPKQIEDLARAIFVLDMYGGTDKPDLKAAYAFGYAELFYQNAELYVAAKSNDELYEKCGYRFYADKEYCRVRRYVDEIRKLLNEYSAKHAEADRHQDVTRGNNSDFL